MSMRTPRPWWTYGSQPRDEDLSRGECWKVLDSPPVGRIGFVAEGYPQIFPVNSTVVNGSIYVRTSQNGPIDANVDNRAVSF